MDSATRAALLAAVTAAPAESVASVAKAISPLATAETRTNPPIVASVAMLPARDSNPPEMPPEIPGLAEREPVTTDQEFFEASTPPDYPVSLATLATWQQSAESRAPSLLPAENPAGNAGNKPADNVAYLSAPADLTALEIPDLIGRLEFLYGGKMALGPDGPVWHRRQAVPPDAVMAILKERRLDVKATLSARSHAAKTRTREPDSWGTAEWLAKFNERAGIMEHDGRMPRATAEAAAFAECVEDWQRRNSPAPGGLENGCWQCGKAGTDADGADPMTSRSCRGGEFYLHPRCWAEYDAAAEAAAKAALTPILKAAGR